jgi:hypothetical protein
MVASATWRLFTELTGKLFFGEFLYDMACKSVSQFFTRERSSKGLLFTLLLLLLLLGLLLGLRLFSDFYPT